MGGILSYSGDVSQQYLVPFELNCGTFNSLQEVHLQM